MLKKLFKIGMVMSFVAIAATATAQQEEPRYSFGSNIYLGAAVNGTWENAQTAVDMYGGGIFDTWRRSVNVGFDVLLGKQINHAWDARLRFHFPTAWEGLKDKDGKYMARYTTLTAEMLWRFSDAAHGYDPDRHYSWYLFAGAGGALVNGFLNDSVRTETRIYDENVGPVNLAVVFGLGYSYRFSEHCSIFAEGDFNVNDYHLKFWNDFGNWTKTHTNIRFGFIYNFGLTDADQQISAQKSMLTQENFNAVNNQVSNLESQVASARNNEKRLENRIAQLEDQLKAALANQNKGNGTNSEEAKKLQATIDQIKADQLNFYAMPFSVQYEVNEWEVSEEEMDKVKAVARVLKDNSDAKIMVVGFADYTGSDQYNMKLSEKRANEVKRLLTKKYGIAEDRITVDYKGKSVAFGDIQYALNRRVSFYRVID